MLMPVSFPVLINVSKFLLAFLYKDRTGLPVWDGPAGEHMLIYLSRNRWFILLYNWPKVFTNRIRKLKPKDLEGIKFRVRILQYVLKH